MVVLAPTSVDLILALGVISLIKSAPVLEEDADTEKQMWVGVSSGPLSCENRTDGVFQDPLSCDFYYRCHDRKLMGVHRCGEDLVFSTRHQACLPGSCVVAKCADDGVYVMPGTQCQEYYKCRHGWRFDFFCPSGQMFDINEQVCTSHGPVCYEPLCLGRGDGSYPDTSHNCRRSFECAGGRVTAVMGCPAGQLFDGQACHSAELVKCGAAAVVDHCNSLSDGPHQAHDCRRYVICERGRTTAMLQCAKGFRFDRNTCAPEDTTPCAFDCSQQADGYHTDPNSGCRDYAYCLGGMRVMQRSCAEGSLYNGFMCIPAQLYSCPFTSETDSKCTSLEDGFHADYSLGCNSYLFCSSGRVMFRHVCGEGLVWNGESCVNRTDFACDGPEPWSGCLALEPGFYQRRTNDSLCRDYYYCSNGNRTLLTCPASRVFNGERCVPSDTYKCPGQDPDSCENRSDGYYTSSESNCHSYFYCSKSHKITYVCAGSDVFNGKECVDEAEHECSFKSQDCSGLPNGYHFDKRSKCRRYFYCLAGNKVITLTCAGRNVFDGRRCVSQSSFQCPPNDNPCIARHDGSYANINSGCRQYFQCINHKKVSESLCPDGKVFNGSACVSYKATTACSLQGSEHNDIENYLDCGNSLNGFYQDLISRCRRYFYCIEGVRTVLTCPSNQLFDGQLCVDSNSYSCPPITVAPCKNNISTCNKTIFQT